MSAATADRPLAAANFRTPVLSVVVPCYDEEGSLKSTHARLCRVCEGEQIDFEIILINDGSRDATWRIITGLAESDPRVVGVDLTRNFGHQCCLSAGLDLARGLEILIIDADLQDPPELLAQMRNRLHSGFDVVVGRRTRRLGESHFKRWSAFLFYRLLRLIGEIPIGEDAGDFRLLSRPALDALLQMPERSRFLRGMISWVGFPQTFVDYERAPRIAGRSGYPLWRMLQLATDAIAAFSVRPLKVATILGVLLALLGFAGICLTVSEYRSGGTIRGWSSLMVVVLFTSSAQLVVLGVIGEYLGRVFLEVKGRPLYLVRRLVRHEPSERFGESQGPRL